MRITKKPNSTANQTNRSRQMKPWSGMSLGSPAKKAGKQWKNRSHFSESHHKRSTRDESRWRLVRAVDGSSLSLEEVAESKLVVA